jgi:hypothetical protein
MHRRKKFLIYPPNYKPGEGYKVRHSKFQAWKEAVRMGAGAGVDVCVQIHPAARKNWISSTGPTPVWEVSSNAIGEGPGAASCARSLSTDGLEGNGGNENV